MTHAQLQKAVVDLLHAKHYRILHVGQGKIRDKGSGEWRWRTIQALDGRGFPDILAVQEEYESHLPALVVNEIKIPPDLPTYEQDEWLRVFRNVPGAYVKVVTPEIWISGEIEQAFE